MPTTESIQINITASTNDAVANVEKLNKALKSAKDYIADISKSNISTFNVPESVVKTVQALSTALNELKSRTKNIKLNFTITPENAVEQLSSIGDKIARISTSLATVKLNQNGLNFTAALAGAEERILRVEEKLNGMANESKKSSASIGALKKDMFSLSSAVSVMGKSFGKVGKMLVTPITGLGKAVAGLTHKTSGLLSSLKRIAMYRILRTVLKEFTQAIREGVQNLYQYSQVVGTNFSKSLDKMATAALYVKNSLATIVEPIVNQIAPIIDMLADKFAAFAARAAEFLANLFGQATYSKAIKYPTQFAEAAGNAAKQLQKWLGPFDEINRLNAANGSGSNTSLDYKNMFETILVSGDGIVSQMLDKLREAIKSGDFTSISSELGKKLATALQSVPWDEIKKRTQKIATGIGTSISGFLTAPDMMQTIGKSIANLLNTGIAFFSTLTKTIKWSDIGSAVGKGLKSLFTNFDFVNFIGTIGEFALGVIDFLTAAINEMTSDDWRGLGKKIGEGIKAIPWKDIFVNTLNLGATILDAIFEAIGGAIDGILGTKDGTGKTIAEVTAVGLLAVKMGSLLKNVLPINDAFGEKNKLLQNQNKLTQTETSLVANMGTAFSNVVVPVGLAAIAIGLVTSAMNNSKTATNDATTALKNYMQQAENAAQLNLNPAPEPKKSPSYTQVPSVSSQGILGEIAAGISGVVGVGVAAGLAGGSSGNYLQKYLEDQGIYAGSLAFRAGGGFVKSGEAFIARENGASEFVGRFGNRTTVANNQQIVEGVASGVEEANAGVINAIYAIAGQIVSAINRNKGGATDWNNVARQITRVQARQAMSANV